MRGTLQPHDPFTADTERTLEAFRTAWGAVYEITRSGDRWLAARKDETGGTLRGLTPDDLTVALKADWCSWPEGAQ